MSLRMHAAAVAGIVEQHRRRSLAGKGAVVADIGPEPAGDGPALSQDGNGGVVAVQPRGGVHMLLDERLDQGERGRRRADMIGQRRDVEGDAFLGVALALAIERLMHPVLLEQDHGEQAGADAATENDVERCRRLGDLLAIAAGELLAQGLLDEPAAWDDVEGLGDDLAYLDEPMTAAAGARGRRRHDHPLPWQMRRQRSARRALPRMGPNHDSSAGMVELAGRLVLGHGLLELGELELELLDQPAAALAGGTEPLAAGLGQEQLEALDLELGAGHQGQGGPRLGLGLAPHLALGQDHGMRGGEILG